MKNIILLFLIYTVLPACSQEVKNTEIEKTDTTNSVSEEKVVERYTHAQIGKNLWTCVNLDVTTFRNGDNINFASNLAEWQAFSEKGEPVYCYPSFNEENRNQYGLIYNWHAVNDPRGIAPEGWHIPSQAEWKDLIEFAGGKNYAGEKLRDPEFWNFHVNETKATNATLFSVLPAGYILLDAYDKPKMKDVGVGARFWANDTTSTFIGNTPITQALIYSISAKATGSYNSVNSGCSVRCVAGAE